MKEQRFEVGVGIIFAGLMMQVIGSRLCPQGWRQFFKPCINVVDQAAFIVVHINGRGNVHGSDETETVTNATFAHHAFDFARDVDHLITPVRFYFEVVGMHPHTALVGSFDRAFTGCHGFFHPFASICLPSCVMRDIVLIPEAAEVRGEPGNAAHKGRQLSPAERLRAMYEVLLEAYGPQHWWPSRTPFETIIGAYLVQNTSWRGVARSIANLEAHGVLSVRGIREVALEELRTLIRPSGYMIRKGAALKAFVHFLDDRYEGSLEALASQPTDTIREQLLALPAVGPETADAILLYALGHAVMVVDEYLRRVALRHEIAAPLHAASKAKMKYDALQQLAVSAFAADAVETLPAHFNEFHALIVEVGKNHCGPRPRCEGCPLASMLPAHHASSG